MQARADWRTSAGAKEAQRFGEAFIRGYRRVRRLAAGPVSELYLAESEQAGALVVLKVARDQRVENELDSSFRRFLQEYEIVQRIRHPGVVRLYDLGVSDQHAYLVMEYFRAGDLRRRMRLELTPREALRISFEIARALDGIHNAGVLHRDLKPGNVMMRDDGSLALIDFGLAKDAALAMEVTDHGTIFGTPHYMSPEQGHGEPHRRAQRSLQPRGDAVRDAGAGEAVPVRQSHGDHLQAPQARRSRRCRSLCRCSSRWCRRLLGKTPEERYPDAATAIEAIRAAAREHLAEEIARVEIRGSP